MELAQIQPLVYDDKVTGNTLEVTISERFSVIKVNRRHYYFVRETGEFDGTGMDLQEKKGK